MSSRKRIGNLIADCRLAIADYLKSTKYESRLERDECTNRAAYYVKLEGNSSLFNQHRPSFVNSYFVDVPVVHS